MIFLMPHLLKGLARMADREAGAGKPLGPTVLAITLMVFMLSAFTADAIGLHAVFGGFLLGAVMPRGALTERVKALLEPFTVVLLLPMFFTYSGLNTQLTMVNNGQLLLVAGVVLAASVLAKFGACWAAARLSGQDNRTALGIGALMNSRGLMELIIINIGLQAGVIGPALFSILVMMAIVTTLMASPIFELVYGREARASGELKAIESAA
jgi:Kef-type K+ transport system membrane component KefB